MLVGLFLIYLFMNKQTCCLLVYFDELVKIYIHRNICPICTSHVVGHILIFCFEKYTKLHLYFLNRYIFIYNYIYTLRDITSSAIMVGHILMKGFIGSTDLSQAGRNHQSHADQLSKVPLSICFGQANRL